MRGTDLTSRHPEAVSVGESIMLSTIRGDVTMSTREAFNLVTELLTAIDQARGYGEAIRGEVGEYVNMKPRKK